MHGVPAQIAKNWLPSERVIHWGAFLFTPKRKMAIASQFARRYYWLQRIGLGNREHDKRRLWCLLESEKALVQAHSKRTLPESLFKLLPIRKNITMSSADDRDSGSSAALPVGGSDA